MAHNSACVIQLLTQQDKHFGIRSYSKANFRYPWEALIGIEDSSEQTFEICISTMQKQRGLFL